MTTTFYYAPMSSSARVHWALEELGIPYEKVKIDLSSGQQRTPEYLALNPNGKVPLLVDSGVPIFESLAQLIYLGERYGVERGLFPDATMARAEALKWMCWASVSLYEALSRLLHNTGERFPAETRSAAGADLARADLAKLLGVLDAHLATRPHVLGEAFSLADVAAGAFLPFLMRLGVDFAPFTHLSAYGSKLMSRPALGRAMAG